MAKEPTGSGTWRVTAPGQGKPGERVHGEFEQTSESSDPATPRELAELGEQQAEQLRDRQMLDYLHGGDITQGMLIKWQEEIGGLRSVVVRMARRQAELMAELAEMQESAGRLAEYHQGLFFRLAGVLTPPPPQPPSEVPPDDPDPIPEGVYDPEDEGDDQRQTPGPYPPFRDEDPERSP